MYKKYVETLKNYNNKKNNLHEKRFDHFWDFFRTGKIKTHENPTNSTHAIDFGRNVQMRRL